MSSPSDSGGDRVIRVTPAEIEDAQWISP